MQSEIIAFSPTNSSISNDHSTVISLPDDQITFKKPVVPLRKKKKSILDEETYVHKMGKIIERDFFPDLENLKDKVEYLEARENNDIERLQFLYQKYSTGGRIPTPASVIDSPATFDTPEPNIRQRKRKKVTLNENPLSSTTSELSDCIEMNTKKHISLDEFLAQNTCEDDDSFEQIMEDAKQKYMLKKAWMFNAEENHNSKFAPDLTMKALPANEHEARAIEKSEQAKPLMVENWKYKTFSSIMYVPDAHHPSRERQLQLAGAPPREVVHDNTRFKTNPFSKPLSQATVMEATAVQAIKKEGRIGVDGRELSKDTPRVRGYSFVGEASPTPGVDESPLLTWGEVEGTPFRLDRSCTPVVHSASSAPSYSMPKVPYRDVIALQLNEKANRAQRDKKSKAVSAARSNLSPAVGGRSSGSSERWATERLANMSPAARRLLSSGLGVRQNTDRTLRASYTPSASPAGFTPTGSARLACHNGSILTPSPSVEGGTSRKQGSASSSRRGAAGTPLTTSQVTPKRSAGFALSLTDGLLQLPRRVESKDGDCTATAASSRQCAADFF